MNKRDGFSSEIEGKIKSLILENQELKKEVSFLAYELKKSHEQNEELKNRIITNSKSGLKNHVKAFEEISDILNQKIKRDDFSPIFFILIKLNESFESINRALKPTISEWVLYQTGIRLTEIMGSGNQIFHTREDEFLIVNQTMNDEKTLLSLLKIISQEIARPHIFSGYNITIKANCGVSSFPSQGLDRNTILHNADIALSYALRNKKDWTIFTEAISDKVIEKMELQNSIIKALESQAIAEIEKQFYLQFQPILTLYSKGDKRYIKRVGAEALIRWKHPEKGNIAPLDFIPLAEETGLIIPLGNWVLYSAARQLEQWQRAGYTEFCLSLNVSMRQFSHSDFIDILKRLPKLYQFRPESLKIELTESCLIDNPIVAIEKIKKIKAIGYKIALDDFGTGYSSLNYLKDLPVDVVKIDKSFVDRVHKNSLEHSIFKGILYFIDQLNLDLVVEGVETKEQLESLSSLGCETFQGFFFSKSLDPKDFINYKIKQLGQAV